MTDLQRSEAFYEGLLGLQRVLDQDSCRIYGLSSTAFIGLCERPERVQTEGVIVTFVTPEVDAWFEHLQATGVPVDKAPAWNEQYRIHHCFVRDPDGHLVEIQRFGDPSWPEAPVPSEASHSS